jgi:hypothetical protein
MLRRRFCRVFAATRVVPLCCSRCMRACRKGVALRSVCSGVAWLQRCRGA